MYKKIDNAPHMTHVEASEKYRGSFIVMQMDGIGSNEGTVLFVGDNEDEMIELVMAQKVPYCMLVTGINHQFSLGGILVGA